MRRHDYSVALGGSLYVDSGSMTAAVANGRFVLLKIKSV
jgi:hypothetical protein